MGFGWTNGVVLDLLFVYRERAEELLGRPREDSANFWLPEKSLAPGLGLLVVPLGALLIAIIRMLC